MHKRIAVTLLSLIILVCTGAVFTARSLQPDMKNKLKPGSDAISGGESIRLPRAVLESTTSVEEALFKRRSTRRFRDAPVSMFEVSQLLWAAQGITDRAGGFRTTPSAGALYPLEVYVVAGKVKNLAAGIYKYRPFTHTLIIVAEGDKRDELYAAALRQSPVNHAAIDIIIAGVYGRTTVKYGERGIRYVHLEAGHAAQNVYLQAVSLNLGTVVIGAFEGRNVKKAVGMADTEAPLYIIPVGKR